LNRSIVHHRSRSAPFSDEGRQYLPIQIQDAPGVSVVSSYPPLLASFQRAIGNFIATAIHPHQADGLVCFVAEDDWDITAT
ncbi:MAG: hypothetical protein AAFU75_06760, partial [Planctomycetota bacterium]